ncbi:Lnb N-terminal periplasmic domain-containing protein [Marinobacter sp. OP 3.4]|uniref:Lnb N-terminal periplasmic domain-containing protein n=1 Tax=Marinobacter sp. OP 3.4 TaxID=3076501 RepID=UPI002E231228
MPIRTVPGLSLGLLLSASINVLANTPTPDSLADLATTDAWLTLGHYHPDTLGSGHTSQADDDSFFFADNGKTDPEAELRATIDAITAPVTGDDNNHARCRFPARDTWIRSHLELPAPEVDCEEFNNWKAKLNTRAVTLVFAASYLNSPSSMFGHTFLRLDPPKEDGETNLLLANTISYAADAAEHDSEILFAYRGIFGGYPGITTVQPYYEMVRVYSDIENRDLWEYRLNLTPDEVDQMLAHTWEVRNRNFDYYFFDENCAYRLLALIDVARPGTRLLDEVSTHAIPSDTIRWVVDRDLVAEITYRPSAATRVNHALGKLDGDEKQLAAAIANGYVQVDDAEVQSRPPASRAKVLDATYDYVRHQVQEEGWPRDFAAPLSHNLLMARSELTEQPPLGSPREPEVRDDQGHDTMRLGLAGGYTGDRHYAELSLRPAYHDLLDPPAGYRPGAQLQFLRLDSRLYSDNQEFQVEKLVGVEIRSLTPRNAFFSPLSWQVGFGGRRSERPEGNRIFTPYLEGGAGGTWRLGSSQWEALAILTGDLEISKHIRRGYDMAPGLDLSLLHQGDRISLMTGLRSKAWIVSDQHREDDLYLEGAYHLGRDYSIRASLSRKHHYHRYQTLWKLGFHAYF